MDWKKIRQAVRTVLAAVLICAASVGITGDPAYAADMGAVYGIYEHGTGWSGYHGDSKTARAGTGSYVTAIRASLQGQPEGMSGTLSYQVNLSGSGWLSWQENMTPNGSTETDMPLEAVRMAFTGQLAENYDVYYSVYQNGSWTTPVKNGETAGTEGQGLRVDGLWVTVTGKGAEVPEGPNGKSVDPTRPMVALTFDDGPAFDGSTGRILDVLEKYGARATFFMVGTRINDNTKKYLKRELELGCELGNHTYNHDHYGKTVTEADVVKCSDAVYKACGKRPTAFRCPGGNMSSVMQNTAKKEGMIIAYWSVDTEDWKSRNPAQIISRAEHGAYDGSIILMHDIYSSTADAVEKIVPALVKKGYQIVTVSEMIQAKTGKAPQAGQQYIDYKTINNNTH